MDNLNSTENLAKKGAEVIFETFDEKLMYQYRNKETHVPKIKEALFNVLIPMIGRIKENTQQECDKQFNLQLDQVKTKASEEVTKRFTKDWIPKPNTGTKSRWKFLFTGKF